MCINKYIYIYILKFQTLCWSSRNILAWEQMEENGFPQIPLFCYYRNLRKSPDTSGSLRENVI